MTRASPPPGLPSAFAGALRDTGASLESNGTVRFPDSAGDHHNGIAPLPGRAWLRLSGTDAVGFLHDQVSADLKSLDTMRVQPAAYCSPGGRVLAMLRIRLDGDALRAELPAGLAMPVMKRLGLYVLRADVTLAVESDTATFGIWGDRGTAALRDLGMTPPGQSFGCSGNGELVACRLPGEPGRVQVSGPAGAVAGAWRAISAHVTPAGNECWDALDVAAGWPEVMPVNSDRFLPQSLALDDWGVVDYRKGCYPGQEVIARMHYRGRLKRHLYRARVGGAPPAPGAEILSDDGAAAGHVVLAAPSGDRASLLAVLRDDAAEGARMADDPALTLDMPGRVVPPGPA